MPLIWLIVFLIPPALSAEPEHFGRIAGALGAIALIAALGVIPLFTFLPRWAAIVLVAAAFTYSAARTAYDYFILWPETPGYSRVFNVPERMQAETTLALASGTTVYISPSDRSRPMFQYLWNDRALAQSFNGRVCTVFPARTTQDTVWLINTLEDSSSTVMLDSVYLRPQHTPLLSEAGSVLVEQVRVEGGNWARVRAGNFGQVDQLLEVSHLQVSLVSGNSLVVKLAWRVLAPAPENWTMGVYLLDPALNVIAQDDRQPCDNAYITSVWQPDEFISETRQLTLPAALPANRYTLALAVYRLSDGQRLPTTASNGTHDTLLNLVALTLP